MLYVTYVIIVYEYNIDIMWGGVNKNYISVILSTI